MDGVRSQHGSYKAPAASRGEPNMPVAAVCAAWVCVRIPHAGKNPSGRPMRPGEGAPLPTRPDKALQETLRRWTRTCGPPEDSQPTRAGGEWTTRFL